MINEVPLYSEDLIEQLDEVVPMRLPGMKETERELYAYRGRRMLIDQLKSALEENKQREIEEGQTSVQC